MRFRIQRPLFQVLRTLGGIALLLIAAGMAANAVLGISRGSPPQDIAIYAFAAVVLCAMGIGALMESLKTLTLNPDRRLISLSWPLPLRRRVWEVLADDRINVKSIEADERILSRIALCRIGGQEVKLADLSSHRHAVEVAQHIASTFGLKLSGGGRDYLYTARNAQGEAVQGRISAESMADVEEWLRSQGLSDIRLEERWRS